MKLAIVSQVTILGIGPLVLVKRPVQGPGRSRKGYAGGESVKLGPGRPRRAGRIVPARAQDNYPKYQRLKW